MGREGRAQFKSTWLEVVVYLDTNTTSNAELFGNKGDFVARGNFNAQFACKRPMCQ